MIGIYYIGIRDNLGTLFATIILYKGVRYIGLRFNSCVGADSGNCDSEKLQ